jgi:hypothetical protein
MLQRTALLTVIGVLACAAPAAAVTPIEPPSPEGHAQALSPAGPLISGRVQASLNRKRLWATVNTCDTFESPDAMGLRASMPGNGTRQRMYMRFSAQWYSGSRDAWLPVPNGRSPWVYAGSARTSSRQGGWTFDFQTPPYGRAYVLRGWVEYQWRAVRREKRVSRERPVKRARYRVARERRLLTSTGVKGVRGGDPKGTSKAMCAVANLADAQ